MSEINEDYDAIDRDLDWNLGTDSSKDLSEINQQVYQQELTLHDEIINICKETGLDGLAAETGLIKDGQIPILKEYSATTETPRKYEVDSRKNHSVISSNVNQPAISTPSNANNSIANQSKKRKRKNANTSTTTPVTNEKLNNKGLRHFSWKVCEKVQEKKNYKL